VSEKHFKLKAAVQIDKLPDDPLCLRVSIGGNKKDGYYLRYRGDRKKIVEMLRQSILAFEIYSTIGPELEVSHETPTKPNFGNS
jgi:hypothetical protein